MVVVFLVIIMISIHFLGVHIIHHLLNSGHSVMAIIRPNACLDEFELIKQRYAISKDIYTNLSWHTCELFDVVGLEQAFYGATNLTIPATDEPDLSLGPSMINAFTNCSSFCVKLRILRISYKIPL